MTRQCEHLSHFMHANSVKEGCKYPFPLQGELDQSSCIVSVPQLEMTDSVSCPQQMIRNGTLLNRK